MLSKDAKIRLIHALADEKTAQEIIDILESESGGGAQPASASALVLEKSNQQNIPVSGVSTAVLFNEIIRQDDDFTYNAGTGEITCNKDGFISVQFTTAQINAGTVTLNIRKDNVDLYEKIYFEANSDYSTDIYKEFIEVSAGEVITCRVTYSVNGVNIEPTVAGAVATWATIKYQ